MKMRMLLCAVAVSAIIIPIQPSYAFIENTVTADVVGGSSNQTGGTAFGGSASTNSGNIESGNSHANANNVGGSATGNTGNVNGNTQTLSGNTSTISSNGGNITGGNVTGGNITGGNVTGGSATTTGGNVTGGSASTKSGDATTTSGSATTNSGNNISSANGGAGGSANGVVNTNVSANTTVKEAARSAYAPPLTSGDDTCMGSTSGGAQGVGFGISLGTTYTDDDCVRRKDATFLHNIGLTAAAVALMCQKPEVQQAILQTGDPRLVALCVDNRPTVGQKVELNTPAARAGVTRSRFNE